QRRCVGGMEQLSRCSSGLRVEPRQRTQIPMFMHFGNGSEEPVITFLFESCPRRQKCSLALAQSTLRSQIRKPPAYAKSRSHSRFSGVASKSGRDHPSRASVATTGTWSEALGQ